MITHDVGDTIAYTVQDDKTVYTSKILSNSRSFSVLDKASGKWDTWIEYLVENYCNLGVFGVVFDFQIR
jgi:hypothetical protein